MRTAILGLIGLAAMLLCGCNREPNSSAADGPSINGGIGGTGGQHGAGVGGGAGGPGGAGINGGRGGAGGNGGSARF